MVRTLKLHSQQLWNTQYSIVNIITTLYFRSPELIHLMNKGREVCTLWSTSSCFLHPSAPGNHHSTVCLHGLMFSNTTYKCGHTVFVFLWLVSVNKMLSGSIHVVANGRMIPILWGQFSELWQLMSWLQSGHHAVNFSTSWGLQYLQDSSRGYGSGYYL